MSEEADRDLRGDSEALFCAACIRGDASLVRRLLRMEPTLVGATGAVREDHREFMRQFGADEGWTPLHLASHYGQVEVVKVLLDEGANPNAVSQNLMGNRPLGAAVAGGNAAVVSALLEGGAKVNATDIGGLTALHLAANDRRHEIIRVLLATGADREGKDKKGRTARDLALEVGDGVGAELLK